MTKRKNPNALIIFIRNPLLGKVKSRLAQGVGEVEALRIYQLLLAHTRALAEKVDAAPYVFYSDFIDEQDEWHNDVFQKKMQVTGDLGHKMTNAFQEILAVHEKAILIGSDCAELTMDIISHGFVALSATDIVIGPTHDGGYYLIGMKKNHERLFTDMTWSTDQVFLQTMERAKAQRLTYTSLPTLSDIDYIEDWELHGKNIIQDEK